MAVSLTKALESSDSKQRNETRTLASSISMLNNSADRTMLIHHNSPNLSPQSVAAANACAKRCEADSMPLCMRPTSLSFNETEEPPVAGTRLSHTNPFQTSSIGGGGGGFIFNDLGGSRRTDPKPFKFTVPKNIFAGHNADDDDNTDDDKSGMGRELQDMKSNTNKQFLETDLDQPQTTMKRAEEAKANNYKVNVGVPMVGMVPVEQLVAISPLSTLTGFRVPVSAAATPPSITPASGGATADQSQINPYSKSTDIF